MGSCAPQAVTENALVTCLLQSSVFSKMFNAENQGSSTTRYEYENRNIALETPDNNHLWDHWALGSCAPQACS